MKNFNKFLMVLISVAFIASGTFAQSDASPKIKNLVEKQVKTNGSGMIQQISEAVESVPTTNDLMQLREMNELPLPAYANKKPENNGPTDSFCMPTYTYGCQYGDGFTDFAVEQIQNLGSGCANLNGLGWSEYYNLGPAILIPGMTYDFTMSVGYSTQHVNIWIDFNNDNILTVDEMILTDYIVAQSGILYDVPVTIPANATPGAHAMRVMCVWINTFTDPCGSYSYGEAEDYSVIIGVAAYGNIEGYVTTNTGGNPIQGATVSVNNGMYTTTSAANGFYQLSNVLTGTWDINCTKAGFNPITSTVAVVENQTTTVNFPMTAPTMNILPTAINVIVDPFGLATENVTISNTGDGSLAWNANLELLTDGGKSPWDLQFSLDVTVASGAPGNAGVECDGQYYYTTRWASNLIHKYDLNGVMIEEFSIPGVTGLRDLAFDGTYMYGGAAANTIFQMDFVNKTLVSSFSSPQPVRSIAYDEGQDGLWVANWDTDIVLVSKTGVTLATLPATVHALAGIYGTAYDNWSAGGPFLWIFDQGAGAGLPQILYQANLNTMTMTGFTHDVTADLPPNADAIAGGCFTIPGIYPGTVSLGGLIQGTPDVLFMYELAPFATWITIVPASGNVAAGNSGLMAVNFDAGDIPAGTVKTANINFTSDPAVGTFTLPVSMTVGSLQFGHITGNVILGGSLPYNIGDVTEVLVQAGPYSAYPDALGNYDITAYPGTYDVTATLYGYQTQTTTGVVVPEGITVPNINFTMPCLFGIVTGTVTSITTTLPIPNATVKLVGTDFQDVTGADGVYEIIVEAGSYDVKVNAVGFASETVNNFAISAQTTSTLNFDLEDLEGIIVVIDLDGTPNGQALATAVQDFFPGGLVEYTTSVTGIPLTEEVQTVFLLLGIYANNFSLTETEATVITTWLNAYSDRNLYMEGGDTWAFDTPTTLHGYFNINGVADGSADLSTIEGIASYWAGNTWNYSGENNWIDHLEAVTPAINVLKNPTVNYNCAVAYDAGTYKTVGASFEITGMTGGPGFNIGVACVMAWFGYPVFTYGDLEGYVTEQAGGAPIAGANITVGALANGTSGADGYYFIPQVLTGTWDVTCTKDGYNPASATVTIVENVTSTQNFQLTEPQMIVNPLTVSVEVQPNGTLDEIINISNPGNGTLNWTAGVVVIGEGSSENLFDLQFDWPVGIGGGEAGIECDDNYIYTSKWNGTEFYKYEKNGTFIGSFTCGSAGAVRDLAYDGTYFYGAAANTTVFQMDFVGGVLVSQFNAPTDIRAIAYNEDDNAFYGNNWDTPITKFTSAGANLGSFNVGPIGASYYGFAYDNYSTGAPYLWGYAQTGNTLNELVQIQLPSGVETGVSFDVGTVTAVGTGIAGGLAITDAIVPGFYTLLGTAQNVNIWGLELCESGPVWLTIDPTSGTLNGGQNQDMTLHFNALDIIPGYYYAEIHFSTTPNVGAPVVNVTMHVEGLIPATNLTLSYNCTDVDLTWQMPAGGTPDSWNVYRDGVLLANSTVMNHTDAMVDPEVEYGYNVKAVYAGVESQPTATQTITVPTPANLKPLNPQASYQGSGTVLISWSTPTACLSPDSYNIYRDGNLVGSSTTLSYSDASVPNGFYEYTIRAVYYFGESTNSNPAYVLVGIDELNADAFQIFPNPASSLVNIKSLVEITNVKMLNNTGQLVMDKKINETHYQIDVSKFESGIYYIQLETAEGLILRKITVN